MKILFLDQSGKRGVQNCGCIDIAKPYRDRALKGLFFASLAIANSKASLTAFVEAGGRPNKAEIVYNGFKPNGTDLSSPQRGHNTW